MYNLNLTVKKIRQTQMESISLRQNILHFSELSYSFETISHIKDKEMLREYFGMK
jgi:hypothetical protein